MSLWDRLKKPDPLAWLPALVRMADHGGDWQRYEDALYAHFRRDFLDTKPRFPERRWSTKRQPESKGKACTFWHIISSSADADTPAEEDRRVPESIALHMVVLHFTDALDAKRLPR